MSELERKRRQEYRRKRRKWVIIQTIAISLVAIIAISSFLIYNRMNRTYYIHYTERGNTDYKVHYVENNFFEEEWIGSGQAYVSSLVEKILAEFEYDLVMDAKRVDFDYSYSIGAQLLVIDKTSGAPLFSPEYELLPEKTVKVDGNKIRIREQIDIDYVKYNGLTKTFVDTYGLNGANCSLAVTLRVNVLSQCEEFENNSENSYFVALNVPLNSDTFDVNMTSSITEGESKVLACSGAVNQGIFMGLGIGCSVIDIVLGVILIAFIYITRNEDINYTIKVKKLVSAYRSFIQQIEGEFDTTGYQEIYIKSFVEMLGIRDTIQSPVLMSENFDQTCTKFLIPTATKILYIFEIKVDNYDELYSFVREPEPIEKEEEIILHTDVDEDELSEAISAPDIDLDKIEFVPDDDDKFAVAEDEPGVEVVGVVWPERAHKNKVYRYDPDGEQLNEGDIVLVPTRDAEKNREVIRKAAVAHANHRVDPEHIHHPLKKIIGIIKRKVENALASDSTEKKD